MCNNLTEREVDSLGEIKTKDRKKTDQIQYSGQGSKHGYRLSFDCASAFGLWTDHGIFRQLCLCLKLRRGQLLLYQTAGDFCCPGRNRNVGHQPHRLPPVEKILGADLCNRHCSAGLCVCAGTQRFYRHRCIPMDWDWLTDVSAFGICQAGNYCFVFGIDL